MQSIRAAVCHAFGEDLRVEEVRIAAPGAGEVAVAVEAVAICHSDISYAQGGWGGVLPAVYGHEATGRVLCCGAGVRGFVPGDTVLVTLLRACHSCSSCHSGQPAYCETPRPAEGPLRTRDGLPLHQGMATGAFAERVVVDQSQLMALPADMDRVSACVLACGVITGIGAVVNTARLRPGEDVVVIGAGGVGLNAIQGARIAGARRIVAVDLCEEKLADARQFGATDVLHATAGEPWQQLRQQIGRGADVVIVSVGAPVAYEQAPKYLAQNGRMVLVGMPHGDGMANWPVGDMVYLGQGAVGSRMGDIVLSRDIPWLIDLYQQGRLQLDNLVSRTWSLYDINDAIADTCSGQARRNVILMP